MVPEAEHLLPLGSGSIGASGVSGSLEAGASGSTGSFIPVDVVHAPSPEGGMSSEEDANTLPVIPLDAIASVNTIT